MTVAAADENLNKLRHLPEPQVTRPDKDMYSYKYEYHSDRKSNESGFFLIHSSFKLESQHFSGELKYGFILRSHLAFFLENYKCDLLEKVLYFMVSEILSCESLRQAGFRPITGTSTVKVFVLRDRVPLCFSSHISGKIFR